MPDRSRPPPRRRSRCAADPWLATRGSCRTVVEVGSSSERSDSDHGSTFEARRLPLAQLVARSLRAVVDVAKATGLGAGRAATVDVEAAHTFTALEPLRHQGHAEGGNRTRTSRLAGF